MWSVDIDMKVMGRHDIEEKVAVQAGIDLRVATRRFLEESCELAKKLPAKKKCLFIMRYSDGFSLEEIAAICGVDERTVSKRLKEITGELDRMRKCCNGEKDG